MMCFGRLASAAVHMEQYVCVTLLQTRHVSRARGIGDHVSAASWALRRK